MGGPITVFLVDDHQVIREGVRRMLEPFPDLVVEGDADTAAAGLRGILGQVPDVAIVDVRLPDGSGIDVIREVRSRQPATKCVVFTSYADDEAFFQAVVAGSSGYLVKDATPADLAEAIHTVASGGSLMRPEVIDDLRRRAASVPVEADALLADLTGQERRILGMIVRGMTNREIAHELSLAEKTVRNYVSNILAKVGMKNRTQLAAHVASARRRAPR